MTNQAQIMQLLSANKLSLVGGLAVLLSVIISIVIIISPRGRPKVQ